MKSLLFLLALSAAQGAVSNLQEVGSTPTQIVVSFDTDDPAACTIEVSKSSGYTPLAADVDPALYNSTADDCNRTGNIVSGKRVIAVIGRQGPAAIQVAANGYSLSRSMQTDATYYIRVTQGSTATLTVRTPTIPLGNSRGEALAVGTVSPFEHASVAASPAALPEFPDPYAGTLVKRPATGYGFTGSTSNNWDYGHGDCNKTLSGVKGSCVYTDAAGTGWSATTGTLTDAVRTDDSNYAEYSGTTEEPLFLRLGTGKYPTSTTQEEVGGLSFQNVILKGLTDGATLAIDHCIVADVTIPTTPCLSPLQQVNLTSSETAIRFCKDAPCSVPDAPGDIMYDRLPTDYYMYPNTRVYNTAGDLATWKFTGSGAQVTCDGLYTSQTLYAMDTRSYSIRTVTVSSKSCGSTPPQVTVSSSYDLTHNGTTGVTLFKLNTPRYNPNMGIRIRKVGASAGTVKIGYALWRAAIATPFLFALGSGGFGKRCQTVPLTGTSEYLCHFSGHLVGVSYGAEGLTLKNYGFFWIRSDHLGLAGLLTGQISYNCIGSQSTNDSMWSDTVPGRFYCGFPSNYNNPALGYVDNRTVFVELDLDTSAEKTAGDPDATEASGNKRQRISFTGSRLVTPCLNSCTSTSDDYTPFGQFKRYNANWDHTIFNRVGIVSVQGNILSLTAFSGNQNSHGWVFTMDLGNGQNIGSGYVGTYGNTQHTFAGFLMAESQACRWCALHTYQTPLALGGSQYTVLETSADCPMEFTGLTNLSACSLNGSCSACPNVTLDGYNYNGKLWCSSLDITSSWNGAWGSTPSGWADGDPVAPNGCANNALGVRYWGQKLAVGDFLYRNGEVVRVIAKSGNSLTIIRGWSGIYDSFYGPKTHSNGDTWYTRCGAYSRNPEGRSVEPEGVAWWPTYDSNGSNSDYTYIDTFQNHGLHALTFALRYEYPVGLFTANSPSSLKTPGYAELGIPLTWAGTALNGCYGNSCEKHPAFGQVAGNAEARSWFTDVHPRLFHPATGTNSVALVAGKTFIYKYQKSINPRLFDLEVFTGLYPFRRVDTLSDSASDTGKWCWAVVADDCFSGSSANTVYLVNEAFDTTFISGTANGCREGEFGVNQGDICVGHTGGISASVTQWRLPETGNRWPNGVAMRVVAKYGRTYRESATENLKVDPLGKVLFARGGHYYWLPSFPGGESSRRFETYTSIASTVGSAPSGTSTALIQFGDADFRCSRNRDNTCYAESATLNQTTPYRFNHETLTGVSCASGCTITIPALPGVVYYRWVFRNSGGSVIHTGATQVAAVR